MAYSSKSEAISNIARAARINGTLCATLGGERVISLAAGVADREAGRAYTAQTKTYIASVTKQFTAACVMMLNERGKLDIEHTLYKYVPEYSRARDVTLKQLMNMVSGIPHELIVISKAMRARRSEYPVSDREFDILVAKACAPEACAPADFLALVNPLPLNFAPGARYEYSDTNYMLLGEVVSRVSGLSLAEFMRARIFAPLGMLNSVVGAEYSDAPSYRVYGGARERMGRAHFTTGEGSISTTAEDLCLWLNAVLNGELLSPESWKICFTPALEGYCCGWRAGADGWFTHGGGDLGYSSRVGVNFEYKAAIAYALNEEPESGDMFGALARALTM